MNNLQKLHKLKRTHTYSDLTKLTGVKEITLIRWLHGQYRISKAYEQILNIKLGGIQ